MAAKDCWTNFLTSSDPILKAVIKEMKGNPRMKWDGEGNPPIELIDSLTQKQSEAENSLNDIYRQLQPTPAAQQPAKPKATVIMPGENKPPGPAVTKGGVSVIMPEKTAGVDERASRLSKQLGVDVQTAGKMVELAKKYAAEEISEEEYLTEFNKLAKPASTADTIETDLDLSGVDMNDYNAIRAKVEEVVSGDQVEMWTAANTTIPAALKMLEKAGGVKMKGIFDETIPGDVTLYDVLAGEGYTDEQRGIAASYIIANRLMFGEENDFATKLFKRASNENNRLEIINDIDDNRPMLMADRGRIFVNAAKLGQWISKFGGERRFLAWTENALAEEVIHLATGKVATEADLLAVANEMTGKQVQAVHDLYSGALRDKPLSKLQLAGEYIRMIVQERMNGVSTELFRPSGARSEARGLLAKVLAYIKQTFSGKVNKKANEVLAKLETYINEGKPQEKAAEQPEAGSVGVGGDVLGEPQITEVEDGSLHEWRTSDGIIAGVLVSPTEFRIDGISANEVGKGQGSKMFESLISYLKEKGVKTITTQSAGEGAVSMHDKAVKKGLLKEIRKDGRTASFEIEQSLKETPKAGSGSVGGDNATKKYYQGIPKTTSFMQGLLDENGNELIQGSLKDVEKYKKENGIKDEEVHFVDLDKSNPNSLINKFLNYRKEAGLPTNKSLPISDKQGKALPPAIAKPKVSIHERPEMENPVYKVEVNGKEYFVQRQEGMNPGDTAWYEVAKKEYKQASGKTAYRWNNVGEDVTNMGGGLLGYTQAEALSNLSGRNDLPSLSASTADDNSIRKAAEDLAKEFRTKRSFNFFKNRGLKDSGELLTFLSKPTLEVAGEEITQPFLYDKKKLDDMVASGKNWIASAKEEFKKNATEYAEQLLKDLKAMRGRIDVQVVAMISLLNSIDNDLQFKNLSAGERDVMRGVRKELELEIAKNAREGSLTLNAMRLIHKLYKGEYKFTQSMADIVTEPVQQQADDIAESMRKETTEVSEVVRENKRKKATKEETADKPPAKPKKAKKEKKTVFFEKALEKTSKENIAKLKAQITKLANEVKCGGK